MSFGRSPYYIYLDATHVNFAGEDLPISGFTRIPEAAIAQLIARICARGTDAVMEWVRKGVALNPQDFSDDFEVNVTGGWSHKPY